MKQPTKKELAQIKRDASKADSWEEVEGFKATKPTSIRLSPELIRNLEEIARLRGERSYQSLLKRWVSERAQYEMELIALAQQQRKKVI